VREREREREREGGREEESLHYVNGTVINYGAIYQS